MTFILGFPFSSNRSLFVHSETLTRFIKTGTSINGPITAAKAWPEFIPKTLVATAIVAKQLKKAGFEVHARQTIQYLIVNSKNERSNKRVLASKLLKSDNQYDVDEYLNMHISAAETLLGAFGYTKSKIGAQVLNHEKQIAFG